MLAKATTISTLLIVAVRQNSQFWILRGNAESLEIKKLPYLRQSKSIQCVKNNFGTSFALSLFSLSEKRIFKQ